jgi:putative transposase
LERLVRRHRCPQSLVRRAQIVLRAAEGHSNVQIVQGLGVVPNTVTLWRSRWQTAFPRLEALEAEGNESTLAKAIEDALTDALRPGAPATFTPEQIVQIVAVSLEAPQECGRPVSHWTPTELADEVTKRGIVETISPRQVGRFLKGERPQASSQPVLAEPGDRRS